MTTVNTVIGYDVWTRDTAQRVCIWKSNPSPLARNLSKGTRFLSLEFSLLCACIYTLLAVKSAPFRILYIRFSANLIIAA